MILLKIKAVTPVVVPPKECRRREEGTKRDAGLRPNTEIRFVSIRNGPRYLLYFSELLSSDYNVMLEASKAEKEGYDAVQPDCTFDPAVKVLKELLNIPVVGPLECSVHIASMLGRKFSILVNDIKMAKFYEERVREYGLADKLASIRESSITLEDLGIHSGKQDVETIKKKISVAGEKAILEDDADVIILPCTDIFGLKDLFMEKYGVPVLEPGPIATKMAETLFDLGLKQSKKAYPSPLSELKL